MVLWAISRGISHTYAHWIEGVGPANLPQLTVSVLPAIDVSGASLVSTIVVNSLWVLLAIWPILVFARFLRSASSNQGETLCLQLLSWLFVVLAAVAVVAVGLWLPFSLL